MLHRASGHVLHALAGCALIWSGQTVADSPNGPQFSEEWHEVLSTAYAAAGRFAVADIDSDGFPDFIFAGSSGNSVLFVLGLQAGGSIGIKQAAVLPDSASIARVLSANVGGVPHIFTVANDGTVRDFAGWPLAEQREFSVAANATAAAIGDLSGTGSSDLVVLTSDYVYSYALDSGSPLWNYPVSGARDIALAQLDSNPMDIIIASTPGLVISGNTQATEWSYIDGFGDYLATGPLLPGGGTQWVGATTWSGFSVFRSVPWSPLWSSSAFEITAIATADLDHNGEDVIVAGDGQWGAVHVYDPNTHLERFSIPNPGWGVSAIAAADMDGDGVTDIVFASAQSYGAPLIEVVDSASGQIKWSFTPQQGVFSPVALGDVDGDGAEEFVVAANNQNDYGTIEIFDAATGVLKWQSPTSIGNANDPFYISTSRILLVPHASDSAMDIVLAGSSIYDGRITVIDGAAHNVKLQIGKYASGPMQSRYLTDAALVDFDNDGTLDYVAATEPANTGASGALLQVFSGKDGHVLWTSVAMGSGFSGIQGVLVTGPATDPASELIAVLPNSMRAYNIQTHLLDWTLLATADGASYIPQGISGPEIAVFQHSGAVTFYAAANHAYLRSFALSLPLNAVLPLNGNINNLLVASGDNLAVVDGKTGTTLATSTALGQSLGIGNQLAASYHGDSVWEIGSGNQLGVFRHLFELTDRIFLDGFGN